MNAKNEEERKFPNEKQSCTVKRVLAFCLSLVLALTPVLTGAVSAADGDDATPAIVNPPSFIYDKDGNYLPDATEIPEGGVRLTKTAKPVDGDPY